MSWERERARFPVLAEYAYLNRTRYWSDVFRSTLEAQPNTSAS